MSVAYGIIRKSLGVVLQIRRKGAAILIDAVPTKSAICVGAAVAPKAMIGLGSDDPKIDWKFRHGVKGEMRQLASLECQPGEPFVPPDSGFGVQVAPQPSRWLKGVAEQQKGPVGQD